MLGRLWPITLVLAALLTGCGGGGGGGGVGRQLSHLDEWLRGWSDDITRNTDTPNALHIPPPPKVELPTIATQIGRDVDASATSFSSETGITYTETKQVFCTWFGWYVETGELLPSAEQFPYLLIQEGFNRTLPPAPPQRLLGAIEFFRNSIAQAQSEPEEVANASAAAACSIPSSS